MISSQDLKYFLEVANELNVTRAAKKIGVTQPTLSHSINRLENELKTKLFFRTKKGVQLTRPGTILLRSARQLSLDWEKVFNDLRQAETQPEGKFTLGCHPAVAQYALTPFMRSLLYAHPFLEIHLRHDLSRRITEKVVQWEIDIAIVVNPTKHPDLIIKQIYKDEVTLWCSSKMSPLTDTLIFDPELLQSQVIEKKLQKMKQSFKRTIHSSDLNVISTLVRQGCGVGILPERVVRASGLSDVRKYTPSAPTFLDHICLIFRPETRRNKGAQTIIQSILEAAAP